VKWQIENWKKIADVRHEFGLVNSTIQPVCKNRTKIISVFQKKRSRIKQFQKPKWRENDEALFKWFKQQKSANVPVSSPLLTIIFVPPKF